jgi:hypothetical protein
MEQLCDPIFDLGDRRVNFFSAFAVPAGRGGDSKPSIAAPLNRPRLLPTSNVDVPGTRGIRGSIDRHGGARKAAAKIALDDFDVVHL